MRGNVMPLIMNQINRMGTDISSLKALEFFPRKGNWHTQSYANKVNCIEVCEIKAKFSNDLIVNIPQSSIRIRSSFEIVKEFQYSNFFNLIVFDNLQGVFGKYCEHFECLKLTPVLILQSGGLVIFNINKTPFNYDKDSIWAKKRSKYYDTTDASKLDANFLLNFYEDKFESLGFRTVFSFEQQRNKEYLSYLALI